MHQLVYYSIFAIILYFVLSSVFETFSAEQENFDPSLVPVSSIVTLAKVAQKLVNGNGTLTNPGNLQIGASASAPGNLTVTGGINTIGFNGTVPMPEVTADGNMGVIMRNTFSADRITMGKYHNDQTYDVIRSSAPAGLLLTSASKKVTVWGQNKLQCDNDLQVNGNATVNGTTGFGGSGALGFKWSNENAGGWACLRSGNDGVTAGGNRLCFHKDHGLAHFFPDGRLDITGKITVPLVETTTITASGSATVEGELSTNNGVFIRDRNKGNRFAWYTDDAGRLKLWVEKSYNGSTMTGGPAANVMDIDTNGSISLRTGAAFCIGNTCVDQGRLKNWIALETRVAALEGRAAALEARAGTLETNTIKVNDPITLWNWQGIDTNNNSVVWQSPNNFGNTIWFQYWGDGDRPIAAANGSRWKTLFRIAR